MRRFALSLEVALSKKSKQRKEKALRRLKLARRLARIVHLLVDPGQVRR
jgi:hypothetical protein